MKDVLVVYASFGQGHTKAAEAIAQRLEVPCCDILAFTHPFIGKIYSGGYLFVTQHVPFLWSAFFALGKIKWFTAILHKSQAFLFSSFFHYLREKAPRVIISTHFSPPKFIAMVKDELNCALISVVTDIRAHPLWVTDGIDCYFVAFETTKKDLCSQGARSDCVYTGYVPLREGFLREYAPGELFEKFSLPRRPTLLFVSSLQGAFPYLRATIAELLKDFNIIVIYGSNGVLRQHLEDLGSASVRFFPCYDAFWELVAISSVIITKPGGLTVFEGIYKKKSFVFTHFIPGQEKQNMDFLTESGCARYARNKEELLDAIACFAVQQSQMAKHYPIHLAMIHQPLKGQSNN